MDIDAWPNLPLIVGCLRRTSNFSKAVIFYPVPFGDLIYAGGVEQKVLQHEDRLLRDATVHRSYPGMTIVNHNRLNAGGHVNNPSFALTVN